MNRRSFGAAVAALLGMLLAPRFRHNAREDRAGTFLGYAQVQRRFYRIPDAKYGNLWAQRRLDSIGAVNDCAWQGSAAGTVTIAAASVQRPKGENACYLECIFALMPPEEGASRRRVGFHDLFPYLESIKAPGWALDIRAS